MRGDVFGVWYKEEFFASVTTKKGFESVEDIILHWCEENDMTPYVEDWLIAQIDDDMFLIRR